MNSINDNRNKLIDIPVIGSIKSCYNEKWGTPRQGQYCSTSIATIYFDSNAIRKEELLIFNEYSHIMLVFVFNMNKVRITSDTCNTLGTNDNKDEYLISNAKVTPPKINNGEKRGCLATRSPHRPVPIGLSVCIIKNVDYNHLKMQVGGVDIIDGTPILEIFPYSPYFSMNLNEIIIPNWIKYLNLKANDELNVYFSFASFNDIMNFPAIEDSGKLGTDPNNIKNATSLFDFIIKLLKIDPRSRYSKKKDHKLFGIKLFNDYQLIYQQYNSYIKVIRLIHSDNKIIGGLSPRTMTWYSKITSFLYSNTHMSDKNSF
ncbi:tRNA-thr(GGU) m(6)t(6)A37 methyltransferase [Cryptosporidium felis]|nr:tRNA-thr(GGU) m(6)t(6)A37 methyltransferase [Cryptosporidium felis]